MSFFWVGHFEFFFQKKIFFFCFIPMKISPNLYGRMDGSKFWCFPWFPENSLLCVILRYTVYVWWNISRKKYGNINASSENNSPHCSRLAHPDSIKRFRDFGWAIKGPTFFMQTAWYKIGTLLLAWLVYCNLQTQGRTSMGARGAIITPRCCSYRK